jgi:hypothetical protein
MIILILIFALIRIHQAGDSFTYASLFSLLVGYLRLSSQLRSRVLADAKLLFIAVEFSV